MLLAARNTLLCLLSLIFVVVEEVVQHRCNNTLVLHRQFQYKTENYEHAIAYLANGVLSQLGVLVQEEDH